LIVSDIDDIAATTLPPAIEIYFIFDTEYIIDAAISSADYF
jgi:hypothetical protein